MSDATVVSIVTGLVTITTMVVGFFTLWIKLRYAADRADTVEGKLDANTALTRAGASAAATAAHRAATAATEAKAVAVETSASIEKKLNGGLDGAVEAAIKPLRELFAAHAVEFHDHAELDERNMQEIRTTLATMHKDQAPAG